MSFTIDQQDSYRVEVSGWDKSQDFFVEKTMLDWRERGIQEISLQSTLREGSVVFVQLLSPLAKGISFPVAYQAVNVGPRSDSGKSRARLEQLHPRASYRDVMALSSGQTEVA